MLFWEVVNWDAEWKIRSSDPEGRITRAVNYTCQKVEETHGVWTGSDDSFQLPIERIWWNGWMIGWFQINYIPAPKPVGCRPSTLKGWWIDTLYQWKTPAKLEKPLFKHEPPRTKHTYPPPQKSTHGHATEAVPHWCSNIPGRFGLAKLRRRNSCWKHGCERHLKKWWENV